MLNENTNQTKPKLGSTGAAVYDLQQDLTAIEYYAGAIDGIFGAKTKKAVIQFQKQFGLNVDGIVSYETEATLKKEVWLLMRPTLKLHSQGKEVKILQKILQYAVYYGIGDYGITSIDGVFGADTLAAVMKFQADKNLITDGVVTRATWEKLTEIISYNMSSEEIIANQVFSQKYLHFLIFSFL